MYIDISKINQEEFCLKEDLIAGEKCYLVFPHAFPKWTKEILHYRSTIVNSNGLVISAGFPKFFNQGEAPQLYPNPDTHSDWDIRNKLDGSLLSITKYKHNLIHRTRGTFDASKLDNGNDIEIIKQKYPKLFNNGYINLNEYSIIVEWVSPSNRIVIGYPEVDTYLIGMIKHQDYSLVSQRNLDNIALELNLKRPERFYFTNLVEAAQKVKEFKDKEGVVLYFNSDQNMIKLKGDLYLKLHKLKSELSSLEKIVDLYIQLGRPNFNNFYDFIEKNFDFEIAGQVKGQLSKVCDANKQVENILQGMRDFVERLNTLSTRKDQALRITSSYGNTGRTGMLFKLLDGKSLEETEDIKKLLLQCLKN